MGCLFLRHEICVNDRSRSRTVVSPLRYCMDAPHRPLEICRMRRDPQIEKLSDEFGQYKLVLTCECAHVRRASPHTLANLCGWDAPIAQVVKRLRCSKCGKKKCSATTVSLTKPRGLRDART